MYVCLLTAARKYTFQQPTVADCHQFCVRRASSNCLFRFHRTFRHTKRVTGFNQLDLYLKMIID